MRHKKFRFLTIIAAVLFLAILYIVAGNRYIPDASATGGAFPSTKHGGGTVDNIKFEGVDRSLGGEVGYYYDAPEAGRYKPGECNHCHEPHSSFGEVEPPPATTEPHDYLLFDVNTNLEICGYCHNNMMLGIPPQGPGYGYWGFFQSVSNFGGSSHGASLSFQWPGISGDTAWPRVYSRPVGDRNKCINCHTPHGVTGSQDSGALTLTNYLVGTASGVVDRQLIAREEALCTRCHDNGASEDTAPLGPAATNIKDQVDGYLFISGETVTEGSGHPVRSAAYFDRHDLSKESQGSLPSTGWLTAGNRHAECTDCHNPHMVQGAGTGEVTPWEGGVYQWSQTSGGQNDAGAWNPNRNSGGSSGQATNESVRLAAQNRNVWGVDIGNNPAVASGSVSISGTVNNLRSWNDTTPNFVYELCLKCHSYWAWNGTNDDTAAGTASAPLWNAPSSTRTWADTAARANLSLSNQPWEFASDGVAPTDTTWSIAGRGRWAYHPVFARGRNMPEFWTQQFVNGTRNPCWCTGTTCPPTTGTYATDGGFQAACTSATGTRTDLGAGAAATPFPYANQTLSQAFVPPWTHRSRVTCTDCHEDNNESNPRGPHGSARPFILRGLDTTISYPRTGTTAFAYSGITDPNNLCINCHRADVYGYAATTFPQAYTNFTRQPHRFDGDRGAIWDPVGAPNGILCMRCHGASVDKLGLIHGNNQSVVMTTCANCTASSRLISTNGAWSTWTKGTVGTAGACTTSGYGCNGSGAIGQATNYNY